MKTTQTNANLCPTLGAVLWTEKMDDFCLWLYARVILACTRINDYNSPLWNWRIAFSWIWFSQVLFQLLPTLSLVLLYGHATQLHYQEHVSEIGRRNRCWKATLESLFTFTLPLFRSKQGDFHFPSTRTINSVRLILGSYWIFSLGELHQKNPSALRAETSSRCQSDPHENQT